jgi:hypothetical protein
MGFWGWVSAIATGWVTASILLTCAWALAGKRIFRKPPVPTTRRAAWEAADKAVERSVTELLSRGGER